MNTYTIKIEGDINGYLTTEDLTVGTDNNAEANTIFFAKVSGAIARYYLDFSDVDGLRVSFLENPASSSRTANFTLDRNGEYYGIGSVKLRASLEELARRDCRENPKTVNVRASFDYRIEENSNGTFDVFNRDGDGDLGEGFETVEKAIEEIRSETVSRFASTKIRIEILTE